MMSTRVADTSPEKRLEQVWSTIGVDISEMDDGVMEVRHDWVQKAFPTTYGSRTYPEMPGLDREAVMRIQLANSNLREQMESNVSRFLEFLEANPRRLAVGNHNRKRITRILDCLVMFRLDDIARDFLEDLRYLDASTGKRITNDTFHMWEENILRVSPSDASARD